MKICCISDLHGDTIDIQKCDVLIIAGDVCPVTNHAVSYQLRWLDQVFSPWLASIDAENIVGIAGNHDFVFEEYRGDKIGIPWIYLNQTGTTIGGLKIYGHPYTPAFCNWAFMDGDLDAISRAIPIDTNILVTHGPPLGLMDKAHGENVGCKHLKDRLDKIPQSPLLHVFGHIHEGYGIKEGKCISVNASVKDGTYRLVNDPIVVNLQEGV